MSGCTTPAACFIGLILAYAAAMARDDDNRAAAPRTPFYGVGHPKLILLLTKPGVQKELGLDLSESQKLLESLKEIEPTNSAFQSQGEVQYSSE